MSKVLSVLIVLAFLFGNYFKPSFISPDIRISFLDLVVGLVWILAAAKNYHDLVNNFRCHILSKPLIVFICISWFSLFISGRVYGQTALLVGGLYLVRFAAYSLLFVPLSTFITHTQSGNLLRVVGFSLVFTGILQYAFLPDIRFLNVSDWDPHYYRVVGTLLDPGYQGLLLVFTLLIFTQNLVRFPLFHSISWAVTYLTFAFTYSRSSFLSFISGFALVSLFKKSWRYFLSAVLLISVTMLILPRISDGEGVKLERVSTIQARLVNWGNSLTIFSDHLILGVGFNTYRYAQKSYNFISGPNWQSSHGGAGADSSLLFVAATTGIFGLAAYVWYLFSLWKISLGHIAFRSGLVALFVHSWFLNSLFYPFVLVWLALWLCSLPELRIKSDH